MSAPRPGADLRKWADQIVRFLDGGSLLPRKKAQNSARDGLLLWDESGYPVVSRSGDFVRLSMQVDAPASASAAGEAGQWAQDTDYIYVCTATDTWKRAAISTWP